MCEGRSRIRTQGGIVICSRSQERNEGKNTIHETRETGRIKETHVRDKERRRHIPFHYMIGPFFDAIRRQRS